MIELVVAMMISAIVVSIAFYSWSLFSAQLMRRQSRSAVITEYTLFQRAIGRDFENAQRIGAAADSVTLLLDIDGRRVRYAIGGDRILRDLDGLTDTFRLGGKILQRSYVNDSIPLVSGLQLNVTFNKEDLFLALKKDYTIADLLRAQKEKNE